MPPPFLVSQVFPLPPLLPIELSFSAVIPGAFSFDYILAFGLHSDDLAEVLCAISRSIAVEDLITQRILLSPFLFYSLSLLAF